MMYVCQRFKCFFYLDGAYLKRGRRASGCLRFDMSMVGRAFVEVGSRVYPIIP